jgi:hypothetical protein
MVIAERADRAGFSLQTTATEVVKGRLRYIYHSLQLKLAYSNISQISQIILVKSKTLPV